MGKSDEIVARKIELKNLWGILKGEGSDSEKRLAAKGIQDLQKEIKKLEPGFSPIDLQNTQYSVYLLDVPKKAGGWPELSKTNRGYFGQLGAAYNDFVATAVSIVRERNPELEVSSPNLFGQIVNATTSNLVNLATAEAVKTLANLAEDTSVYFGPNKSDGGGED